MRLDGGARQLTYCTNIHAANGWSQVFANLRTHAPAIKARLSPDRSFGLGLRLSRAEAQELSSPDALHAFQEFLAAEGLYVALLNGYPYGPFSGEPVKSGVFAPDWRSEERLRYTLELVGVLVKLLPDGTDGGISTVPLSYKPWMRSQEEGWSGIVANIARICGEMVRARNETGQFIHLDIEPEPDGLVENTAEMIAFFRDRLLPKGAPMLAGTLGVSVSRAGDLLLDHVRVCFDTCHFAVEYEDPERSLAAFANAGIRMGRIQLSSALAVRLPEESGPRRDVLAQVQSLCEPVYLHQVIERQRDGTLRRYRDLPDALERGGGSDSSEWRIHFHVPLFAPYFGALQSTRDYIQRVLRVQPLPSHFEIETYTWAVLPPELRLPLTDSVEREYLWVLDELCAKQP